MSDREKVIKGLECRVNMVKTGVYVCPGGNCEYCDGTDDMLCGTALFQDALALLKEQEEEIKRLKNELHGFGDLFHELSEITGQAIANRPEIVRCKDCKTVA